MHLPALDVVNVYAYASGDPISTIDPLGLYDSVTMTCMRDPAFCRELFGQITQNAAAASGDPCMQEAADAMAGAANTIANIAAVLPAISSGVRAAVGDAKRVADQAARRAARRERQSRAPGGAVDGAGNPQKPSGEGYRDHENANRGPGGTRPAGPDRSDNRERNIGIDEEHSRRPKGGFRW